MIKYNQEILIQFKKISFIIKFLEILERLINKSMNIYNSKIYK